MRRVCRGVCPRRRGAGVWRFRFTHARSTLDKFGFLGAKTEEDFFRKWTEKESWLKYTGAGLKDFRRPIAEDAHFEHFEAFEGYDACVCAEPQDVRAYLIDLDQVEGREGKDKN